MGKHPIPTGGGGRDANGEGEKCSAEKHFKRPKLGPPQTARPISSAVAHGDDNEDNNPEDGEGSIPGYVRYDGNKVRICLNLRSKEEIRELNIKLVRELAKVRSFKRKLVAQGIDFNRYINNDKEKKKGGGGGCGSGVGGSNRVGPLDRVNSTMSCVDHKVSRPCDENGLSVDYDVAKENVDRVSKERNQDLNARKKLNTSCGGKSDGMRKEKEDGFPKVFIRRCQDLLQQLMKHQYGWVFNQPVDAKKLKLHDYYKIIKHPMDLGTIKSRLSKNWYRSPSEFAEDVRLTFNNAMTYNQKGQDVHMMADVLLKIFEERWAAIKAKSNFSSGFESTNTKSLPMHNPKVALSPAKGGQSLPRHNPKVALSPAKGGQSLPRHNPKGALSAKGGQAHASSAHRASDLSSPADNTPARSHEPRSAHSPMHLETNNQDRLESKKMPNNLSKRAAKVATNEDSDPPTKKVKLNDHDIRDMTFEEKQRLGRDLQSLSSEKLEGVIQILRKRKPGLFNQEDEIEVDILTFDAETLWELDNFINPKSNNSSKRMDRPESPKVPVTDTKDGNASRSSSSSGSGSNSRSSSSDSDNDS